MTALLSKKVYRDGRFIGYVRDDFRAVVNSYGHYICPLLLDDFIEGTNTKLIPV